MAPQPCFVIYDIDILEEYRPPPQLFFIACPSFGVCLMFFHDYIETVHSRLDITGVISHPSQAITQEAHDFQLPLFCDVNFDHAVKVLSDFSTVQFLSPPLLLISHQ